MLYEDLCGWEVIKEVNFGRLHACQVSSLQAKGRWCPSVLCVHLCWRGELAAVP
jgi:hypothetical protein